MTPQTTLSDAIESTIASLPEHMQDWVRKEADLCKPDAVEIITGKADQIIGSTEKLQAININAVSISSNPVKLFNP